MAPQKLSLQPPPTCVHVSREQAVTFMGQRVEGHARCWHLQTTCRRFPGRAVPGGREKGMAITSREGSPACFLEHKEVTSPPLTRRRKADCRGAGAGVAHAAGAQHDAVQAGQPLNFPVRRE